MTSSPQPEGTVNLISKIVNFLKDLLDLITGKSEGPPIVNPDGGSAAAGAQTTAGQATGKIESDPVQGVSTTTDGGINYDKGVQK